MNLSTMRILRCAFAALCLPAAALAQTISVPGVGWEGQGADIAITNLDANPRQDMILMAYDNPARSNSFRYRVGRNLNANGQTSDWSTNFIQVPGVGWEGAGAGLALTNLDSDSRPEMILMAYDDPQRGNSFRYRVGRNLNARGIATSWSSNFIQVPGVGWEGQGADVLVTNIDNNNRPDMILMAYDNPSRGNFFRYKVGKNLDSNGQTNDWTNGFIQVPGVGWEGAGAGMTIANINNNPRPDLIMMAYDDPSRGNTFRYRIGFDLNSNGVASSWQSGFSTEPGLGWEGAGAGIALGNVDGDDRLDLFFMAYDDPPRGNEFRYRVKRNFIQDQPVWLEIDRLANVSWLPNSVTRNGVSYTLPSVFRPLGIDLNIDQDQSNITDPTPNTCYTDAELDAFLTANYNSPPPAGSQAWHMYLALLTCHTQGIFGVIFDTGQRRGVTTFMNVFGPGDARVMRTTAHEIGHALCLYHSDGDARRASGPVAGSGASVMNQTWAVSNAWDLGWSAASMHKIFDTSKARWRPQSGVSFNSCG